MKSPASILPHLAPSARAMFSIALGAAALLSFSARTLHAQDIGAPADDSLVYRIDPVVVTATGGPRVASDLPRPVSVLQRRDLVEQKPNSISDLFRTLPGLDVTGVGVSQVRPQIRGQGGQRILLLADGLRMNNTRRQRDFGELPALVDVAAVEQVEVVRGPASVLYGSDAIGGVVNIITEVPTREGLRGSASYLYGSAAGQNKVSARVSGRSDRLSIQAGGMWRSAEAYDAPSGTFGDITLADGATVLNSGVEDRSFDTRLTWSFSEAVSVFAKVEHYRADDTGFGFVHPNDYDPGSVEIDILYPMQRFTKLSGGLRAGDLGSPLADAVSLTAYGQDNERELVFDAFIPFFPGAGMDLDNRNFTDIRTYGFRGEAHKMLENGTRLTYGVDGFQDGSVGTDVNTSTIRGFGPPIVDVTDAPSIPDAELLSLGAFAQAELDVGERVSLVGGGRYQRVSAETFATDGLTNTPRSESNGTLVGALNALVELTAEVDLVASVGRGFRSPNLVELFFEGVVPEGSAYQRVSEDLQAETSLNVDFGLRYQSGPLFVEGFLFRNRIMNGIRGRAVTDAAGDTVTLNGLDVYQNVNIDEIIMRGVELNADVRMDSGVMLGGSLSVLDAEDAVDPDNPIGESYSRKVTGRVGYRDPGGRFWGQWEIRYSGEQKDVALGSGNPLGAVLPSFTVQGLRGGARVLAVGGTTHGVTVSLSNLFNALYAETANASFFRPEPKRSLTVSWDVTY